MRREWDERLEMWAIGTLGAGAFLWFTAGLIFALLDIPIKHEKHADLHWAPASVAFSLWLGPFILAGLGLAWHHRPRRTLVPIKEDLRKANARLHQ